MQCALNRYNVYYTKPEIEVERDIPSCVRGYHVYKEIWTAVIGETLSSYVIFRCKHISSKIFSFILWRRIFTPKIQRITVYLSNHIATGQKYKLKQVRTHTSKDLTWSRFVVESHFPLCEDKNRGENEIADATSTQY